MSLVARHLEENGMPTVIVGSAQDIVEYCGVPRFLFVDFPLGNPCGKPWDEAMHTRIVRQALTLFEDAAQPNTTLESGESWGSDAWRERFLQVTDENRAELAKKGALLRANRSKRERRAE